MRGEIGRGASPVEHIADALSQAVFLVAHVNDADDRAIEILARTGTVVAYCPRASAYFGADRCFGPHRYRDMLDAGVTVALGTDSIVNLPPSAADPDAGGISVLDEMRLLHRRDRTEPATLLRMATVNGAIGLGLDPELFEFRSGGDLAGLVAVDVGGGQSGGDWRGALERVLLSDAPPVLLAGGVGA